MKVKNWIIKRKQTVKDSIRIRMQDLKDLKEELAVLEEILKSKKWELSRKAPYLEELRQGNGLRPIYKKYRI